MLGSALATSYFVYHTQYGTHGLQARHQLLERSRQLEQDIAGLKAVRRRLRQDIAALSNDPPGPDVVEEQARALLGFVRPGDLILTPR